MRLNLFRGCHYIDVIGGWGCGWLTRLRYSEMWAGPRTQTCRILQTCRTDLQVRKLKGFTKCGLFDKNVKRPAPERALANAVNGGTVTVQKTHVTHTSNLFFKDHIQVFLISADSEQRRQPGGNGAPRAATPKDSLWEFTAAFASLLPPEHSTSFENHVIKSLSDS